MIDAQIGLVLYAIKVVRVMVLWIALYVVEKVYQDSYVQSVLVNDGEPPRLSLIVVYVAAIEGSLMLLLLLVLSLLKAKYKTRDNTFIIDNRMLVLGAVDFFVSTSVFVCIGSLLGEAAQNGRLFRYKHDGLRAIRALCNMLLYVSIVVLAMPYYRIL